VDSGGILDARPARGTRTRAPLPERWCAAHRGSTGRPGPEESHGSSRRAGPGLRRRSPGTGPPGWLTGVPCRRRPGASGTPGRRRRQRATSPPPRTGRSTRWIAPCCTRSGQVGVGAPSARAVRRTSRRRSTSTSIAASSRWTRVVGSRTASHSTAEVTFRSRGRAPDFRKRSSFTDAECSAPRRSLVWLPDVETCPADRALPLGTAHARGRSPAVQGRAGRRGCARARPAPLHAQGSLGAQHRVHQRAPCGQQTQQQVLAAHSRPSLRRAQPSYHRRSWRRSGSRHGRASLSPHRGRSARPCFLWTVWRVTCSSAAISAHDGPCSRAARTCRASSRSASRRSASAVRRPSRARRARPPPRRHPRP